MFKEEVVTELKCQDMNELILLRESLIIPPILAVPDMSGGNMTVL